MTALAVPEPGGGPLVDRFGRHITYLRLSVTDRCDLRCFYCMPERQQFVPRKDLLTIHELHDLAAAFIDRGVTRLRITGGEPLVRPGIMDLVRRLGDRLGRGLDELLVTTNGTQLAGVAASLHEAGVRRINVSLDTLSRESFRELTRRDRLPDVLAGIAAARKAGLKVKINTVALKGINEAELPAMVSWAHERGMDISLIEVMPMGDIGRDRAGHYLPLTRVRDALARRFTLRESPFRTGGPSRYLEVAGTGRLIGLIAPLTNNFCAGCNRVRLTAAGRVHACLAGADATDLKAALRGADPDVAVSSALDEIMRSKPREHAFRIEPGGLPALARHMSATGG